MTAAAKDVNTFRREGDWASYPVKASTKIYTGTLVCIDSNGLAVPAADASGNKFVGVARAQADNSAGAASAINVDVWTKGVFRFTSANLVQGDVGKPMFVSDDQTMLEVPGTNGIAIGYLEEIESATVGWVRIVQRGRIANYQGATDDTNAATVATALDALITKLRNAGLMSADS